MEQEMAKQALVESEKDILAKERILIRKGLRVEKEQKEKRFQEIDECPECGSRNLELNSTRAEVVCSKCGLVLEENKVDPGPEWGIYDAEKCARTGPPADILINDKLTTVIDWKNKDLKGKYISSDTVVKMGRLRRIQRRLRISSPKDRNLSIALGELNRMASALGIPKPIEKTAAVIYRKAMECDIIRGRSIEGMMTACLYAACKKHKVSRTLDEIAEVSRVPRLEIGRCYRTISAELKLGIHPASPLEFIPRFCSPFEFPDKIVHAGAEEIIKQAERLGLTSGKGPEGIAASAIYIASRNTIFRDLVTQSKLAKVSGVTEVTIRNGYKRLVKDLQIEMKLL